MLDNKFKSKQKNANIVAMVTNRSVKQYFLHYLRVRIIWTQNEINMYLNIISLEYIILMSQWCQLTVCALLNTEYQVNNTQTNELFQRWKLWQLDDVIVCACVCVYYASRAHSIKRHSAHIAETFSLTQQCKCFSVAKVPSWIVRWDNVWSWNETRNRL